MSNLLKGGVLSNMNTCRIPVYQPCLSGRELEYVTDCIKSNWISSKGKYVKEFEDAFCRFTGAQYASSVSNGTVAIHLALLALGIGIDDEVIVPTLTYVASVNSIVHVGARPVFVDSDPLTWQMDPKSIFKNLTPRTKAIMVVHLYGHPCDMDEITSIANDYDLFIVEDCAEAFGAYYKGRHVGTFGDISTFSFYGNKTITTGEGGMVVTNNKILYDRVVRLKNQGVVNYKEYWHDMVAYNYRMTNICAAIGLAQLEQARDFLAKKRQLANWYKEELKGLPVNMHSENGDVIHSYWMCSILVEKPELRDELRMFLAKRGVETRPLFYPVHTMPMYSAKYQSHPVAESLGSRGINLPSWPGLTREHVKLVAKAIKDFYSMHD
ncbi:MAG: DegT/DnrJ/EryC1/StrS family aminotransferase [Desulfurispora sp.]|uniref:DegT/DnrJ/EryC1/StrS family aminotransferase n=1 Tax=Desulfurispora sp. TaxID=3014275 RepID=UPI00404A38AE